MYPDWGLNWGTNVFIPDSLALFFMDIEWKEVNHLA